MPTIFLKICWQGNAEGCAILAAPIVSRLVPQHVQENGDSEVIILPGASLSSEGVKNRVEKFEEHFLLQTFPRSGFAFLLEMYWAFTSVSNSTL